MSKFVLDVIATGAEADRIRVSRDPWKDESPGKFQPVMVRGMDGILRESLHTLRELEPFGNVPVIEIRRTSLPNAPLQLTIDVVATGEEAQALIAQGPRGGDQGESKDGQLGLVEQNGVFRTLYLQVPELIGSGLGSSIPIFDIRAA